MRAYGLATAPHSGAYGVYDSGGPSRYFGDCHGRRRWLRRIQAKRERARSRRAIRSET